MEGRLADLVRELRTLRKGRGIFVGQIGDRVGPALRELCCVADSDGPAEIRRKVGETLERLAHSLPDDLRAAAMAAFALDRNVRQPFYQDRVRWVADRLQRDDRTARRRIDEAIDRLAELALDDVAVPDSDGNFEWHTDHLRMSLALDRPVPEAYEFRRIVADRDELCELDLATTLTASAERIRRMEIDQLQVDVLYGGRLIERTMESSDRVGLVLELPKQLSRAEVHEYALCYRVLTGDLLPHYVCVPRHRCDHLELRVRFDPDRLPTSVWRLADTFQRDIDDPAACGEPLPTDSVGEVRAVFRQLTPGLAYGVRWAETGTRNGFA